MNKNYQIPIQTLRDDFKGYLGIENAKGTWQNTIRIWSGNWIDIENRENSYVYQWKYDERGNLDYIADKWGDEEDVDKIFLLRNAPIPFEEPQQDPNPKSNKFVDKKYIDDRFNGIRKISVTGETLAIRPYSCVYEFDSTPTLINIVDTETLQDGRTVAECIGGNILTFIIKFNVGDSDELGILANGKGNVKWSYPTELADILDAARKNNNSDVWIECFVGYTEDGLSIRCSNALNPMPCSEKTLETTESINLGNKKVPLSDTVYNFVNDFVTEKLNEKDDEIQAVFNHTIDSTIHVTSSDKTDWNNKVSSISGDTYIKTSGARTTSVSLSLNVADEYGDVIDEIEDKNKETIPNSRTVWEFSDISKYFFPYLKHDDRKDYILYDKIGNPMYISFVHKLTNGNNMFFGKTHFTSVLLDFPELIDGSSMFQDCSNLTTFGTETLNIEKLENGSNMFKGCHISVTSLEYILGALERTKTQKTNCVLDISSPNWEKQMIIEMLNDKYNQNISSDDLDSITQSVINNLPNEAGGTWNVTITYR